MTHPYNVISAIFCGGIFLMMIPMRTSWSLVPLLGVCLNVACILGAL